MKLDQCWNFHDFRKLARQKLPGPVFNYIDGGADDEVTLRKNTASFDACDLVPNVLKGTDAVDMSVEMMGQSLDMPVYCSPTALQRLFHHRGERAVAAAAAKFGTLFGVSSIGTVSLEELRQAYPTPQAYQFYFHKDRALNRAMMDRAKQAGVNVMMLTVDAITGGNRERDLRTGFSIPVKLTLAAMAQFAMRPSWVANYLARERFRLPQLEDHLSIEGGSVSVGRYFTEMLDQTMNWDDAAEMVAQWGGPFCLKGVMSVEDARRAVDIGCTGIILSNHGGRQLDGSRAPFDQLGDVMDAVGGDIDVMMDSGVQRGTHVIKALSMGAKAVGIGRYYLFGLAAAGQAGVERVLGLMQAEIERGLRLMGCASTRDLSRSNIRFCDRTAAEMERELHNGRPHPASGSGPFS